MARTFFRPILALALAAMCPGASVARAQVGDVPEGAVDLPGPASSLAAAMRLDPATPRARLLLEVIRQVHAGLPSQCPECDAARRRLAGWTPAAAGPDLEPVEARRVPLPWSARTWRGLLGERVASSSLPLAILGDRRAALLYHGLMGVDPATRAYLESRPKLRERLYERLAPHFAAFGRSLPVRDGVVALPGGQAALPLWEDLVGERASDPDAFIPAALAKWEGRLAYFLDTVSHLDRARQAFALGAWQADREAREGRVRALARAFVDVRPEWRVAERPFARPLVDPAFVLLTVSVTPEGRFAPPGGRGFWEGVFRAESVGPETSPPSADTTPVDAAWIVAQSLTPDVVTGRDRLFAVAFAQRLFGRAPAAQASAVARAAQGFFRYRTAMIAVERIGAADPEVFDRMAQLAANLTVPGAALPAAQLQASLALLERLGARGSLTTSRTRSLLDALVALPRSDAGRYEGALTAWLDEQLLPALGAASFAGDPESLLVDALAGPRLTTSADAGGVGTAPATVTWEGVQYLVDLAGAERTRLVRVRRRQAGNALDVALDFARRARQLGSASTPAAAHQACTILAAVAGSLDPVPWPEPGTGDPLVPPAELVKGRCDDLAGVRTAGALSAGSARQAVRQLADVADAVVTDTLVSIVYALHVGDPSGAVDLAPDLARRHRFAMRDRLVQERGGGAWTLPRERVGDGTAWHVEGSLLGLEHALAGLSLRFLVGQEMPAAPRVNQAERTTLALGVALMNPFALGDRERDALAAAQVRGRERIGDAARLGAELDALCDEAGWSEWRRESLRWAITHDPEGLPSLLTPADHFWAGRAGDDVPVSALAAWGPATTPVDGDLRLAWPEPRPWEQLSGRSVNGQLSTRFVDLTLRVAELMVQYELPASLAPAILAPALADLIHEAPLGHPDDWYAMGAYARGVPDDRMLDYIASLSAGGPLAPATTP